MDDCIFCKIISKEVPATIVMEADEWICIKDLNPRAPLHLLIIPKIHCKNLHFVEDENLLGKLMSGIKSVVKAQGLEDRGYRVVINTGNDGGQTVSHLHLHLLAKRSMGWPPG